MRRIRVLGVVIALFIVGVIGVGWHLSTVAQDATPSPEETGLPAGIAFELIASGEADELPAAPALFQMFRISIEPGAVFEVPEGDPTVGIPMLESGAVTVTITAPVTVGRIGPDGAPGPTEEIAANTAFDLEPGESFVGPPGAGGSFRNGGTETAVLLGAHLVPIGG